MSMGNSELAEAVVEHGPETVNANLPLSEIGSLLERAFEDSMRDLETIHVYTTSGHRDAVVFIGIVVAYDADFVVLVENPGKSGTQQNLVRRSSIIGVRSVYNMMEQN